MHVFIQNLENKFESLRNLQKAGAMKRYMKNQFQFLGISSPERKQIVKDVIKINGLPDYKYYPAIIKDSWSKPEREWQYAAMELSLLYKKKISEPDMELFEYMIKNKSWWDTVDFIAVNPVGIILKNQPSLQKTKVMDWCSSDNLWLQRTALLFQLKYKENTDHELLFYLILKMSTSRDFFIQKAMGWALREYSKTNPVAVLKFVEKSSIPSLTRREAVRLL